MKHIKKFNQFLNETKSIDAIDTILDKINDLGYESLNDREKSILQNLSNSNNNYIKDVVIEYLDNNYSDMEVVSDYVEKSINVITMSDYFLVNDEPCFQFQKLVKSLGVNRVSNILYIDNEIYTTLSKFGINGEEIDSILKDWFYKNYNLSDIKMIKIKF